MEYDVRSLTGSDFCYNYHELFYNADQDEVREYCNATRAHFAPIAKSLDENANAIWVLRHFLAIKFFSAAAVLSGSAEYAAQKNLLLAVPYFNYYTLFNCCRGFLLTCPDVPWTGATTVEMTHSKIINVTGDRLMRIGHDTARQIKQQIETARDHRELYSYRFPGSGPAIVGDEAFDYDTAASTARFIAELAMLNSECFEASLAKHNPKIERIPEIPDHEWSHVYEVAGEHVVDNEDYYRFQKYVTKWRRVSTLDVMATDGLIEELYGSWHPPEDSDDDAFNPDEYMRHILSL